MTDDLNTLSREVAALQNAMRDVQAQLANNQSGLKDFAGKFEELEASVKHAVDGLHLAIDKSNKRIDQLEHQHVGETCKRLDQLDEQVALLDNALEYFRKRVCVAEDNAERQSDWYREQFENRIVAAEDARSTLSEAVVQLRRQVSQPSEDERLVALATTPRESLEAAMRRFFDDQAMTRPKLSGEITPWYLPDACITLLRKKGFDVENPD